MYRHAGWAASFCSRRERHFNEEKVARAAAETKEKVAQAAAEAKEKVAQAAAEAKEEEAAAQA
jgi:hypothetical protein